MGTSTTEIVELDGMPWRPKRGARSTAEEFTVARAFWKEAMTSPAARWNPWDAEDRKTELDAARDVMEQWTRAEPGFRPMTVDRPMPG